MRTEAPPLDRRHALGQQALAHALVEGLRELGRCGLGEARPVAARGVADERELADHERGAAHVEQALVEAAVGAGEHPQPGEA